MIDKIQELIIETARELTDQDEIEISGEIAGDTTLFGREGILDSMGLVSLIIAVEQAIEENYGILISLADEKALSQHQSPYRTVLTLAGYAVNEIEAKQKNG